MLMLSVSLIIPVYNEENQIAACLDAIADLADAPDEVLVIDNNCSDNTISIAKKYDFVSVIKETRQGLIYARNTGFNSAKSDIYGRIDADAVLDKQWIRNVKRHFENDKKLAGLTGPAHSTILPFIHSKTTYGAMSYFRFVNACFRTKVMWGANMAIRATAWETVKDKVTLDDRLVHEDQDISVWIAANSGRIEQFKDVLMTTDGSAFRGLQKTVYYFKLLFSTRRLHRRNRNLWSRVKKAPIITVLPGFLLSSLLLIPLFLTSIIAAPYDMLKRR